VTDNIRGSGTSSAAMWLMKTVKRDKIIEIRRFGISKDYVTYLIAQLFVL